MIIIADAGSSKTDWACVRGQVCIAQWQSPGINPLTMSSDYIRSVIHQACSIYQSHTELTEMNFYGAGCNLEGKEIITGILHEFFPKCKLNVDSDLLASVRCFDTSDEMIVAILGTGSNACLSDGHEILMGIRGLGFILGDFASGSDLGKRLIQNYFCGVLESDLTVSLEQEFPELKQSFIAEFYSSGTKAAMLANYAKFVINYKHEKALQELILHALHDFQYFYVRQLERNKKYKIGFTGSIAFHLQEEIKSCFCSMGYAEPYFVRQPIESLIKYHIRHHQ